ncbi:hypothetical protein OG589_13480 [Sphaerisporangium sp. NBC_01403]|uniref:hypothetical protein n=1 Tax=Sphaerisporangium sp. NBC_01403 TaxID=2903599 RepID=UPI0032494A04
MSTYLVSRVPASGGRGFGYHRRPRSGRPLERISSPIHGSTARALVAVVNDGSREAITGWLRNTAGRWDSIRPYLNAAFDAAAVDPELRGRTPGRWSSDREQVVDVPAESWAGLLSTDTPED